MNIINIIKHAIKMLDKIYNKNKRSSYRNGAKYFRSYEYKYIKLVLILVLHVFNDINKHTGYSYTIPSHIIDKKLKS